MQTKISNQERLAKLPKGSSSQNAFTLLELMVVLGVLMVMATLLGPAMARPRPNSQASQCLNNNKQLIMAWQMYMEDNNGRMVENYHGGQATGGAAGNAGKAPWASGWQDWTLSTDNTNSIYLVDEKYARLARYFNRTPSIYHCPGDNFVSAVQKAIGWTHRARSISANLYVGEGNAEEGPVRPIYRHIKRSSDFIYPAPSEAFVFMEEHPDSMNDPGFFSPGDKDWIDQPASYHYGAAAFSFADGHVDLHKWVGSLATPMAQRTLIVSAPHAPATYGDADLHWVSYHTPRNSTNSY